VSGVRNAESPSHASDRWRRGRLLNSRIFLRTRIDCGVTSTYSSSVMNSIASSRLIGRTGMSPIPSFATGWLLRKLTGKCPWDYSNFPGNIQGLITLE